MKERIKKHDLSHQPSKDDGGGPCSWTVFGRHAPSRHVMLDRCMLSDSRQPSMMCWLFVAMVILLGDMPILHGIMLFFHGIPVRCYFTTACFFFDSWLFLACWYFQVSILHSGSSSSRRDRVFSLRGMLTFHTFLYLSSNSVKQNPTKNIFS